MTQQAYEQTVKQQEHIENILTKKSFGDWADELGFPKLIGLINENKELTLAEIYLKEHGLPLDSIIKGL